MLLSFCGTVTEGHAEYGMYCCGVNVRAGMPWNVRFQKYFPCHGMSSILSCSAEGKMPDSVLLDLYWQGFSHRLLQSFTIWCLQYDGELALGYSLWCERRETFGMITFWLQYIASEYRELTTSAFTAVMVSLPLYCLISQLVVCRSARVERAFHDSWQHLHGNSGRGC